MGGLLGDVFSRNLWGFQADRVGPELNGSRNVKWDHLQVGAAVVIGVIALDSAYDLVRLIQQSEEDVSDRLTSNDHASYQEGQNSQRTGLFHVQQWERQTFPNDDGGSATATVGYPVDAPPVQQGGRSPVRLRTIIGETVSHQKKRIAYDLVKIFFGTWGCYATLRSARSS